MSAGGYEEVSSERPCESCGKVDWCWRTADDTVTFCRRVKQPDAVERHDKSGEVYFLHSRGDGVNFSHTPLPVDPNRVERADIATLDAVYKTLLNALGLSPAHRDQLLQRGLSDEVINRMGVATLPPSTDRRDEALRAVRDAHPDVDLCHVPGFFRREPAAQVELAGAPGLLIPTRDAGGAVRSLRIRLDDPPRDDNGKVRGKYRYLSAPRGTIGCGPGAQVHVPLHDRARKRELVRITEGELKAEIATTRTDLLTLSIPGASLFEPAIKSARELGARWIVLAFDADARRNPSVASALQRCALRCAEVFGVDRVGIEHWPEDAGKGIDDLLVGSRAGELTCVNDRHVWATVARIVREANARIEPLIEARCTIFDAEERLSTNAQETCFTDEVLVASGVLRSQAKAEYELLVARVKKAGVRLREWEREVQRRSRSATPRAHDPRAELPEIVVDIDEAAVAEKGMAAIGRDPNLYQRGGQLVQVIRDGGTLAGITRVAGTPRIAAISQPLLREFCSANARWLTPKHNGREEVLVEDHVPTWTVAALHQRGQWGEVIRYLEGVVEWPFLRPDGTVASDVGYDSASGLLLVPNCEMPEVPEVPTATDVAVAIAHLREIACDFPFATPAHEAAFLAAMLTPFARYSFNGPAPLMLIDKNNRGAGGSLLSDVISQVVVGRPMARMAPSPNDEEERKRITALALSGTPLVLIDNVAKSLGTPSLDAALTATEWQDRVLGSSQVVRLPLMVTWFATGNNITLGGDTSRRCLHIRLETEMERPEERVGFKHDPLLPWVRAQRPVLMRAVLTLLRAYVIAGRPKQALPAWGSFEGWSDLVRGCLVWAGLPDPGETRRELIAEADETAGALADFVTGWEEVAAAFGGKCTVAQALTALSDDYEKRCYPTFRAALDELVPAPVGQLPNARRVGATLKKYRGRVAGGRVLVKAGDRTEGGNVWTVISADQAAARKAAVRPAASAASAVSPGTLGPNGDNPSPAPTPPGPLTSLLAPRGDDARPDAADTAGDGRWEVSL